MAQFFEDDLRELWSEKSYNIRYEDMARFIADPTSRQVWPVIPAGRLKKIWTDYARTGIIRDSKGLDEICDRMISNVILLEFNTVLSGHTSHAVESAIEDLDTLVEEWTEELDELHSDYIADDNGQWRLSDYALDPLLADAWELFGAASDVSKLMIVDRMLQRVHCRSDIAGMFVEGGSQVLDCLFTQEVA
jgi:hypothetical protein